MTAELEAVMEREFVEDMAAWSRLHEQMRASAEFDHARIEDFEEAPLSQWLRPPAESSRPRDEGSNEGGEASAAVLELWRPDWLCWDASAEAAVKIMPDRQPCLTSMSQEMQSFRERVDAAFGWHGKVLDAQRREFRAAAQVSLLHRGARSISVGGEGGGNTDL